MQRRTIAIVLGLIIIGIGWYLFRPERLFVSKTVSEEFPASAGNGTATSTTSSVALAEGRFHGVAHETKGIATIHQLPDGQRVLRFTDFQTSNGPDVQVYLGMAPDANDNETVTKAGFFHIGPLKGNIGDQNYDLPLDLDLTKYHSVTIWCRRFGVNFGTAPLSMSSSAPVALFTGQFHGVAHETKGMATIHQLPDGKRVLRFTDFQTSNGPDVQVYLGIAPDANDNETVTKAGFYHVGPLKGNIGDQNYDLPSDLDLSKYHSVTIWCRRFGVNFATAPLTPQQSQGV